VNLTSRRIGLSESTRPTSTMTKSLKIAWTSYVLIVVALITTSITTGRRATRMAGSPHYLFTRTQVFIQQQVAPEDQTDAALDALFEEAGESTTMTVAQPAFVLGLVDAVAPVTVIGAATLAVFTVLGRRRRRAAGKPAAQALP